MWSTRSERGLQTIWALPVFCQKKIYFLIMFLGIDLITSKGFACNEWQYMTLLTEGSDCGVWNSLVCQSAIARGLFRWETGVWRQIKINHAQMQALCFSIRECSLYHLSTNFAIFIHNITKGTNAQVCLYFCWYLWHGTGVVFLPW